MAKPPTIIDIARRLNLANTTVAEVLRGKPGYNEHTRQRVLQTAKRVGYRPNYLSKALAGSKSKTIGVLVALTETPALYTMIRTLEFAARRNGYLCYLVDYGHDPDQMIDHVQNLLDRRVDGLLLHQSSAPPEKLVKLIRASGVPLVRVGQVAADGQDHVVRVDRDKAAQQMAAHLSQLGHRHVALIASAYVLRNPELKVRPYGEAFAAVGITMDASARWMIEPGEDYSYGCMALFRREIPRGNLPTAFILNSDLYAVEALAALHDAGLSVPGDVSLVGFEDDYYASLTRPALTTIRHPHAEVGERASAMLMRLIDAPQNGTGDETVYCELVERDSTGPVGPKREM